MVRTCIVLGSIAAFGYIGSDRIIDAVRMPLEREGVEWVSLTMIEPIMVKFKIAFYTALVIGLPYIVYQICAFVFPGLKPKERRVVKFALFSSAILGLFGMLTAFFGVFPFVLPYLMAMAPEWLVTQLRLSETVTHIFKGVMGFAVAFQFPIVILVFVYLGVVPPKALKEYRKVAIIGIFIACAMLTPPDPITLVLMALPLLVLYEISIWAAYLIYKEDDDAEESS
jgi:sec-independent protein translocase protein TatC